MKLKSFNPRRVEIQQYLFMKKLTYAKRLVLVVLNLIGFATAISFEG